MELVQDYQLGLGRRCYRNKIGANKEEENLSEDCSTCLSKPAGLSLASFVACQHPVESCRHNGLPLTPNSTSIIGKAHALKSLNHPHLCSFLDCQRGKGERIIVASEYYENCSLADLPVNYDTETGESQSSQEDSSSELSGQRNPFSSITTSKSDFLLNIVANHTLSALVYLDKNGIVHVNLEPKNILLTNREYSCNQSRKNGQSFRNDLINLKVKLYEYGLGHMTNYGEYVAFSVFVNPAFTPPEIFHENPAIEGIGGQANNVGGISPQDDAANCDSIVYIEPSPPPRYSSNCSVWSLGMTLACQFLGITRPWPNLKASQTIRKVMSLSQFKGNMLERLAREHNREECLQCLSSKLKAFIDRCLIVDPASRPNATELMSESFTDLNRNVNEVSKTSFPTLNLRCKDLEFPPSTNVNGIYENGHEVEYVEHDGEEQYIEDENVDTALDVLNIHEIYYLWQLAGGDALSELRKCGLVVNMPAVLSLPSIVLGEGHVQGQVKERSSLYDPSIISLNLNQLTSCLESLSADDFYPTFNEMFVKNISDFGDSSINKGCGDVCSNKNTDDNFIEEAANLPLVIRERDVRYQFTRIVLYRRLLQGYPYTRPNIWKEARLDSLPLYRAYIWAALLGINHDVAGAYETIDKETWTTTDRQIEVDIPRCHQYNYLLASPEGHRKFKRVLKAWVVTNPQYVYWQGLDSLAAPFLLLNFNDEALAYACLSAFIPKYLYGMFRKDNANVIQEYLAKFCHLQAFHDPVLFNHLDGIGFIPDLYAIPWVLTLFAHVFPLHNIFHLWDKLLLGNSSFPLCVALAILYQLRDRLLGSEFNDCILLFSDLPAIDIERCVKDSIQIFCSTPKSLTYRKYGSPRLEDDKRNNGESQFNTSKRSGVISKEHITSVSDLTMESITLEQQKREKVPRISGEEALILLGLAKTRITGKPIQVVSPNVSGDGAGAECTPKLGRMSKSRMIILDVRSSTEFKRGALPDSINIPFTKAFSASQRVDKEKGQEHGENLVGEMENRLPQLSQDVVEKLNPSNRGSKLICVVGSSKNKYSNNYKTDEAQQFADGLLHMNYNRVCTLHNGIEPFRALAGAGEDVLVVPNA